MKKYLLLIASAALLFAGCQKEQVAGTKDDGSQVTVTFTTNLAPEGTKAVADNDGNAAKVNHWILEVRDAQNDLFITEERDVAAGTTQQTYELKLFKNQTYTLMFWADTKGAYNTTDLTAVSRTSMTANADSLDAFSAKVDYTSLMSESKNVVLKRPFGQLNIITTDLDELVAEVKDTTYAKYAPSDIKVVATVPTTFNVKTQTAGDAAEQTLTAVASYAPFSAGASETTLFMDYILASKETADVVDLKFSLTSKSQPVEYDFTNIPLQSNYRTNIKGRLMSNDSQWTVTIDPIWSGVHDVNYVTAGTIEAANDALASGETNIVIEEPADFETHVVFPASVAGKDVTVTLNGAEGKTIFFENAALTRANTTDGPASLTILADVQNLDVDCPLTDVVLKLGEGEAEFPVVSAKSLSVSGVDGTVLKTGASGKALSCESALKDVEIKTDASNQGTDGALNVSKSSSFENVKFTGAAKYILVLGGQDTQMDVTDCDFANEGKGRGIMVWGGSPAINIEGSSFDNVYPFNVDAGTPVFTVTNSTLNGWTSFTGTATASFEGCSFGKSTSGYAYCRPYSSSTFTECDFSSDFLVDFGGSGITLTMNDCTVGGSAAVTKNILEPELSAKDGILIIDGATVYPAYTTDANGNFHVATKDGLFTIAADINSALSSFYGKTIFIENDIDLSNEAWTPIQGSQSGDYAITFNGQNHKISNVKVSDVVEDGGAGFFGHWAGTITNLELDGVTIANTVNWSGALCGYFSTGTISNVTVSNVVITNLNETKCKRNGGLCGFVNASTDFSNVAVSGVAITGTEQLGGFIGSLQADGAATYNFTDCSVSDVTITKVGTVNALSFGTKVGGRAQLAAINGDISVSGTNTLPDGSAQDGWGSIGL
ncbi:MAG: hypothetical protein KBT44_03265 [Bacteroidales bacterium]|nr:hypothetical protein [Candidatus Equibacterium intestinale]